MKTPKPICRICGRGKLTEKTYADDFKHGNKTVRVKGLKYSRCDQCNADPVLTDQIIYNQKKIADEKRKQLGLLLGEEIKRIRQKKLRMTQKQAAEIFNCAAKAFSKYERGEIVQSGAMDTCLRVAERYPEFFLQLSTQKSRRAKSKIPHARQASAAASRAAR